MTDTSSQPSPWYSTRASSNNNSANPNDNIHQPSNIKSNWSYRTFLQKNASNIMKYNALAAINGSGESPYAVSNNAPISLNGDLKDAYDTQFKFKSRLISPSIPTSTFGKE